MKHLNERTIQAFLDAELSDRATERITQHLALCERCASDLLKAEAEQAEVNLAFAAEAAGSPCPSQRIWARIENEIDFLGAQQPDSSKIKVETKSFWQQWPAFFTTAQVAFASGLAAVVLISFFAVEVLRQVQPKPDDVSVAANHKTDDSNPNILENTVVNPIPEPSNKVVKTTTNIAPRSVKISSQPRIHKPEPINPKSKIQNPKSLEVLPEEHNYLNSIAELSKAVQASDEFVMRPSFRVEYERNLAVMDGAISAMQKQVRQHPKDDNAKRILFASYQNKIELLNTVAEKSQMIASLR